MILMLLSYPFHFMLSKRLQLTGRTPGWESPHLPTTRMPTLPVPLAGVSVFNEVMAAYTHSQCVVSVFIFVPFSPQLSRCETRQRSLNYLSDLPYQNKWISCITSVDNPVHTFIVELRTFLRELHRCWRYGSVADMRLGDKKSVYPYEALQTTWLLSSLR